MGSQWRFCKGLRVCSSCLEKGTRGPHNSGRKCGDHVPDHTRGAARQQRTCKMPLCPCSCSRSAAVAVLGSPHPHFTSCSPLLLMGLLPPCLPHQTPHLPPAPQLAQAISSRCHLCKVHTLTLNVMPECPSKPAQMPKAPAHRRARAAAVGEGTSAGVCPGLEGCPEGERRVPLAESFMLAGRLGQCSRGACFMAPSLAGKQGTQVTSLKQGTPPPHADLPQVCAG